MKNALLAATGAAALAAAVAVNAADAEWVLEEIIVTAQKRAERLQDVPAAVTALGGETLRSLEISNPTDLIKYVPSLELGDSNTPRGMGFAVRGVGTVTWGNGVEQSVGTVIDGVVMGRPGMGLSDFADIERVEVLRGPQGMLFGKNASAGLISITTKLPQLDQWGLGVRATGAEHGEQRYELIGNVPMGERAALRLVGYSHERDGIIHDFAQDLDYNGRDEHGARASLLLQPTDDLQFILRADYMDRDAPCCMWTTRSNAPFGAIALTQPPEVTAGEDNLGVKLSGDVFSRMRAKGTSLEVNWNVGAYTLTSISAYREWFIEDNNDPDQTVLDILDHNYGTNDTSQFTQELRLASSTEGRFDWVGGVYWYDMDLTGSAKQAGTLGAPLPPGLVFASSSQDRIGTQSLGLFVQADFELTDKLSFTAGARYTNESYDVDYQRFGAQEPNEIDRPDITPTAFTASGDENNVSWRVGLQYQVTRDVMSYFTVARGFKGAAISTLADTNTGNVFVPPEIPTSYELGLKSAWFEGRAIANLAVFRTEFDDFQAQVFDTSLTPAVLRLKSAGKLVSQGVELDFMARPIAGLSVGGGVTYLDAYFDSSFLVNCYRGQTVAQGCAQLSPTAVAYDADGKALANTPTWKYTVYADYRRALSSRIDGFVRANWAWRDEANFSIAPSPLTIQPAYGVLGASIGVATGEGRWSLSLFARNLLDKRFATAIFETPLDGTGGVSQFPSIDAERTVGVTLEANF